MNSQYRRPFAALVAALVSLATPTADAVTQTVVSVKLNHDYAAGNTDVRYAEFTPDGSRLVYFQRNTRSGGQDTLRAVGTTASSPPIELRSPAGELFEQFLALSSDGSRAVTMTNGELFSTPLDGSQAILLGRPTRAASGSSLALSPDGSLIAFFSREDDDPPNFERITIAPMAGGEHVSITGDVRLGHWLEFSSDNATIHFQGAPPGSSGATGFLYSAPTDGSLPASPSNPIEGQPDVPAETALNPQLLPDGSALLYFISSNSNSRYDTLRHLDLASGIASTLFSVPNSLYIAMTLNEDGSAALLHEGFENVHVVDIATATSTLIATELVGNFDARLTPDASQVVIRHRGVLRSHPVDGLQEPVVLSDSAVIELDVAHIIGITPDSSRVVFMSNVDGRNAQLFSNTLDGTGLTRLNQALGQLEAIEFDAQLSVDGAHVIYRADAVREGNDYLFRAPVDGSSPPQQLHQNGVFAGDVDDFFEAPDGSGVGFIADLATNSIDELWFHDYSTASTSTLSVRGDGDGSLSQFLVTPDSTRVVYLSEQRTAGSAELTSVLTEGGPAIPLHRATIASGDVQPNFKITDDSEHAVFIGDIERNTVHELFSANIATGASVKLHPDLADNRDVWDFRLSPDGQYVAILGDLDVDRRGELYLAAIDGSFFIRVSPQLSANQDIDPFFDFSPDSQWLVFTGPFFSSLHIYHVPTKELRRSTGTDTFLDGEGPLITPDSKLLTFHVSRIRHIYRFEENSFYNFGTQTTWSTHDFTPDSRFAVAAAENQLVVGDFETGLTSNPLSDPLVNTLHEQFTLIPHSDRIIAVTQLPSERRVISTELDGTDTKIVLEGISNSATIRNIELSADGRSAVFSVDQQLYHADLTSSEQAEPILTDLALDFQDGTFALSPNGKLTYFIARPADSPTTRPGLFRYDHDSGQTRPIVEVDGGLVGVRPPLALTPDGRQLVFASDHLSPGIVDLFNTMPGIAIESLRPNASDQDALETTLLPALTDITATEALLDRGHWVGLRYDSVAFPTNAAINSIRLTFTASANNGAASRELLLRAQADPAAPAFVHDQAFGINNRPPGITPPIIWPIGAWTVGRRYSSPDLTPILEEVFDLPGWQNGSPVVFTLFGRAGAGAAPHRAWLFDGNPALAPALEIDFASDFTSRSTFDDWAMVKGIPTPDPASDFDFDGVSLFVEYALGLDPHRRSSAPSPEIHFVETPDGTRSPRVRFERQIGAVSSKVTLETSNDLESWISIATSEFGGPVTAIVPGVDIVGETEQDGRSTTSLSLEPAGAGVQHFRYRVEGQP